MMMKRFSCRGTRRAAALWPRLMATPNSPQGIYQDVVAKIKGTVLDAMAKSFPTNDRLWLAQRWGFVPSSVEVDKDTRDLHSSAPENTQTIIVGHQNPQTRISHEHDLHSSAPENTQTISVGHQNQQTRISHEHTVQLEPLEQPQIPIEKSVHPLFGELLTDLGYKKVYAVSIHNLIKIPVWEKQRTLRPARAQKIAKEWMKRDRVPRVPGIITLFQHPSSQKAGIVDGQHRVGAIMTMVQSGAWEEHANNILVDVFEVSGDQDVSNLFTDINSAEPVKLVDMPNQGADEQVKEMLEAVAQALEKKYPEMFKTSQKCRPPHLNIDNLRDELFQSNMVGRYNLSSSVQLMNFLEQWNETLGSRSDEDWERYARDRGFGKSFPQALKKAKDHGLYLGLDKMWLDA